MEALGELTEPGEWSIQVEKDGCKKRIEFYTPGTKAWIAVASSRVCLHNAVFFEGPVLVDGESCRYLLIHYVPRSIRIEGDDDKKVLVQRMKGMAEGKSARGEALITEGDPVVIDPKITPLSLFTELCSPYIFNPDGKLKGFQMQFRGQMQRLHEAFASQGVTAPAPEDLEALQHYKEPWRAKAIDA